MGGYPTVLYLDPKEKRYIEEFSVSNFIGLRETRGGGMTYVTPDTPTILKSATNDMLMDLAGSDAFGMTVERRPVDVAELPEFKEVAGCGTAVVMMGINSITDGKTVHKYSYIENVEKLYTHYRAIQFGEKPDPFGWGSVCPHLNDVAT